MDGEPGRGDRRAPAHGAYGPWKAGDMTNGRILPKETGRRIGGSGLTLRVGADLSPTWSMFEATVPPGFDVGAHYHYTAEELFYIIDGELDLLAFHPKDGPVGDWRAWESADGQRVLRGGPGCVLHVPAGCPHSFANPTTTPTKMIFMVTPVGHEHYLAELTELLSRPGPPDHDAIIELGLKHDIQQLTPHVRGTRPS
ncbi:cupin domain-containing protein [Thermopolyspora sp. NPDC052614]|uniref:cupin domain-containing protein n=1 Tax=Thermopolyspora sp. NPDC052614 TaxID=3155682 RepID=UPI003418789A